MLFDKNANDIESALTRPHCTDLTGWCKLGFRASQSSAKSSPFDGPLDVRYRTVKVDGRNVSLGETADFSCADPWSLLAIGAIKELFNEGMFKGNVNIVEAGVGDGRNLLQAIGIGRDGGCIDCDWKGRLVGIDIDARRVAVAAANLKAIGLPPHRFDVLSGDAVGTVKDYSDLVRRGEAERLTGLAIACLPQVPLDDETQSSADGFDAGLASLDRVRSLTLRGRNVSDYGLTLNAAFLHALHDCVNHAEYKLLIIISDRVPRDVVQELFAKSGWEEIRRTSTPSPVRQDPDTSVQYIVDSCFDNGDSHVIFYEKHHDAGDPAFRKITAEEAETRRKAFVECDQQGEFNVYHYVFAYLLKPTMPITRRAEDA